MTALMNIELTLNPMMNAERDVMMSRLKRMMWRDSISVNSLRANVEGSGEYSFLIQEPHSECNAFMDSEWYSTGSNCEDGFGYYRFHITLLTYKDFYIRNIDLFFVNTMDENVKLPTELLLMSSFEDFIMDDTLPYSDEELDYEIMEFLYDYTDIKDLME